MMSGTPTQREIESQVKAHIDRLESRVDVTRNKVSVDSRNADPRFAVEDQIALDQVNILLQNSTFKKRLCAGLNNTSSDLQELAKPLVKILLSVSAIKSGSIALLGYTWTFASLPIGVIGVSVLAIYLARFGIGYYCGDEETQSKEVES